MSESTIGADARPFEGIKVIDLTHVLAGPFCAYQLAVLGADTIKVEPPGEPDQVRESGTDKALNRAGMGTNYLGQAANKRSITLDLKKDEGARSCAAWSPAPTFCWRTTAPAPWRRSASATRT